MQPIINIAVTVRRDLAGMPYQIVTHRGHEFTIELADDWLHLIRVISSSLLKRAR